VTAAGSRGLDVLFKLHLTVLWVSSYTAVLCYAMAREHALKREACINILSLDSQGEFWGDRLVEVWVFYYRILAQLYVPGENV